MSGAQVYRAFDAADRLLYVGCSVDVTSRLRQHEKSAVWWPYKARIEFEDFPTHEDALIAESQAIATEHPRWNIKDRAKNHPDGPTNSVGAASWLEYERDVSRRFRQLTAEEESLLRKIRRVRFALAGTRIEVSMISEGTIDIDEAIA